MNEDIPIEVTETAGDWLDRLAANSPVEERRAFAEWLLRSPVHIEEFLRMTALRAELKDAMQPDWVADVLNSIDSKVVEIPQLALPSRGAQRGARQHANPGSRRLAAVAVILAAVCLTGWLGWQISPRAPAAPSFTSFITVLGEQRFVLLTDGSSIKLNTESHVEISMTPTLREVELLRGELLVNVAKDPARPFRVKIGDVTVEAIGTRFSVYRRKADTLVAVVEGRVAIKRSQPISDPSLPLLPAEPMELSAGQQVALTKDRVSTPLPANLKKVTAWTEQRVVFEDETLTVVVAEFNRYNRSHLIIGDAALTERFSHLIIGDAALTERRITGRYNVNNAEEFIKVLDALDPVRVQVTEDGHRVLYRDLGHSSH